MSDQVDIGFAVKWTYAVAIMLGILFIVPTTMVLAMQPAWMGFVRSTQKQSHQYVEARESALLQSPVTCWPPPGAVLVAGPGAPWAPMTEEETP